MPPDRIDSYSETTEFGTNWYKSVASHEVLEATDPVRVISITIRCTGYGCLGVYNGDKSKLLFVMRISDIPNLCKAFPSFYSPDGLSFDRITAGTFSVSVHYVA
jgi:hypothetical protein